MTHVDKNESNHAQVELSQVSSPFSGICFPYLYPGMARNRPLHGDFPSQKGLPRTWKKGVNVQVLATLCEEE
jgi:hypothetical protein